MLRRRRSRPRWLRRPPSRLRRPPPSPPPRRANLRQVSARCECPRLPLPIAPRGTHRCPKFGFGSMATAGERMGRKILLVEDDRETAAYLSKGLGQEGHSVELATNGQDGLFRATDGSFDLIVLDRMLPVLDGISVLKALRAAQIDTPVLVLSALASVGDRIEGLECGSDDYLVKPFSFAELLARVNALLRRRESRVDPTEHRLTVGDLEIDPLSRTVRRAGKKLDLKPREYLLLEYFARNEGRVVTRTMLLEQVWDYHFDPGTNVIDVHVSRLRRKLDEGFDKPLLHTVRGAGYMLAA